MSKVSLPSFADPTNLVERKDEEEVIELGEGEGSLHFLQRTYRSTRQPMRVRMRAAIEAAPYENPKLAVIATRSVDGSFAERLDRHIEYMNKAKVIEGRVIKPEDEGEG